MDYYATLGISKTASESEIKKAYHKLAMQWHPDRHAGDKAAEQKFKEINEAYEVLKDPQKRAAYDQYGSAAFAQGGGFNQTSGADGFDGFAGFGDFADIFNSMFGGATTQRSTRRSRGVPGSDISYDLNITLEQAFSGAQTEIKFRTFCPCDQCNGTGSQDKKSKTCPVCHGSGVVVSQNGFMSIQQTCSRCSGSGSIFENPCSHCGGLGRIYKDKTLEVKIPKGIDTGTRIRLSREGEAGIRGGASGDLYVCIMIKPHALFQRKDKNLICKLPVSMMTAIFGGEVEIATLDKRKLAVKIPAGIQTNTRLKIKGQGMPSLRSSVCGDLFVEVVVETPVNLTSKQKDLLKEFVKESEKVDNSPNSTGFLNKIKRFFS